MKIQLYFHQGCTGDSDELVDVTLSRMVWSGVRAWLGMTAGDSTSRASMVKRSLLDRLEARDYVETGDVWAKIRVPRSMADWVMVYFELISNRHIILRPDVDSVEPIYDVVISDRRLG